jgi:hypothetical protein
LRVTRLRDSLNFGLLMALFEDLLLKILNTELLLKALLCCLLLKALGGGQLLALWGLHLLNRCFRLKRSHDLLKCRWGRH